jgi:hypothetical protein
MTVAGPPGGFGDAGRAVVEPEEAGPGDVGRGEDCSRIVSYVKGTVRNGRSGGAEAGRVPRRIAPAEEFEAIGELMLLQVKYGSVFVGARQAIAHVHVRPRRSQVAMCRLKRCVGQVRRGLRTIVN